MGNKLYVGNLPYTFRDEDLQQAFAAHGTVTSAKVMMERDTGRSKGFGFVTADDASKDVFVHKSVLRRCGLTQLEAGQRVQMKVQEAPKGREATWITPL